MRAILEAKDIRPLTAEQHERLNEIARAYERSQRIGSTATTPETISAFKESQRVVDDLILNATTGICSRISPGHGSAENRVISSLRNRHTDTYRFRESIDEGMRLLFHDKIANDWPDDILETPVNVPAQQRAAYERSSIDNIDACIGVVMRSGLRPAIVLGDMIQEATGKTPTYAIFRIGRSHGKKEELQYLIDDDASSYRGEDIAGKILYLPDPMLATGGSLIAIDRLLIQHGIRPDGTIITPLFAAVEGIFNIHNNMEDTYIDALRVDPTLNAIGYIMPGCGDAGNRQLDESCPADIGEILRRFGGEFCKRYQAQVERIYETIQKPVPWRLFK